MNNGASDSKRVIIIGSPGAGKSTFSKKLSVLWHLPLVHLDRLFWRSGWQSVGKDEFEKQLERELAQPEWILDGNFAQTLPMRLSHCDLVIYLDYPRWFCLFSVLLRVLSSYGKTRSDMSEHCPERLDFSFLAYVWRFNARFREPMMSLLRDWKGGSLLIFHNRKEANDWLASQDASIPDFQRDTATKINTLHLR